ncbi:3-keto-disaccharide hydrolase [Zhouia amylolytica]|uniref:3-keto-alpha-glucoside-1,2-lyase/3-keto-2-hydroxy-glucal hydratase domain-containing protein n=1 Tax=Zhouia amylolytica AD3 TaxID=1286632 RepID=W2UMI8_9FLAO|nr:DUF1080 domain-containing protein [Zhouia amylolytica]ETN94562.1 protein of unknown function (DUF1080) [Zhouia amylolytica AD3]
MKKLAYIIFACLTVIGCKQKEAKENKEAPEKTAAMNTDIQNNGWITLFDGSSFDAWRGYLKEEMPSQWSIEDKAMVFTPGKNGGNNIITKEKFKNFELSLEWKISEGGNSGIFWGVYEDPKFPEAYQTGPEIQVLDDERHPDAKNGTTHQAGSLYDMIAPSEKVVKPAGEWNTCVLKINHETNAGSITLNGTEIVTFPVHGPKWDVMVENSKFKGWEGFGKYQTGHIGLQDHGDKVWYRNIKIKPL